MSDHKPVFVQELGKDFDIEPGESVFHALFREYEHVVFRSIITSFGLDMFITDQYGGDVDTVHNVRKVGTDPLMDYKKKDNQGAYDNRGQYSHKDVEGPGSNFQQIKNTARKSYRDDPRINTVLDAYEDKQLHFFGKGAGHPTDKRANLDHVIAAKKVHDDRGRVLAGLNTKDLADSESNLKWTNEHLNKSMQDKDIPEYLEKHPEIPDDVRKRMLDAYDQAVEEYEFSIAKAMYFDFDNPNCRQFYRDAADVAAKRGLEMGMRQAVGFLFTELWFSVRDAIAASDGTFEGACKAIISGLEQGVNSARQNYAVLFAQFGQGVMSGILASVSTTIINIFFTTSTHTGRIIRQSWASVVEATSIVFFGDRDQYMCDRITSAAKVIAAGASAIVGMEVQDKVEQALVPVIMPKELKSVVAVFAGSLCTGLLSVTLLFYIDNDPFAKALDYSYGANKRQLELQRMQFQEYCAKLQNIDVKKLRNEICCVNQTLDALESAESQTQINEILCSTVEAMGLPTVFGESTLDDKMSDPNWVLTF